MYQMLKCLENTVLPIDERVLLQLQNSSAFQIRLDPDYRQALPAIHGGTPEKAFFTTPSGEIRQIGWFVSFLDGESELSPPLQPAFYNYRRDTRVDDRSIPGIMDDEVNLFLEGERIFPFAALYTGGFAPLTLRLYTLDSYPNDSLCFDQSTTPHAIVLCDGRKATEAVVCWDDGEVDEIDYDSALERIAGSFVEFLTMLREHP